MTEAALRILLSAAAAAGPGSAGAARLAQVEPMLGPFFAVLPPPGKKGAVRAGPFLSLPAEVRRASTAQLPCLHCSASRLRRG